MAQAPWSSSWSRRGARRLQDGDDVLVLPRRDAASVEQDAGE